MSEKNNPQDQTSKEEDKEKGYNLVESIMNNQNNKDNKQSQTYINNIQIPQNKNIKKITHSQLSSENNNINKAKNNPILIMQDMKTKISMNNYNGFKVLLDNQDISQVSKNQLLNLSFTKLYLTNNNIQKKIIIELIEHGADPNYKLKLDLEKNKANNFSFSKNIKLTPLIYCCIKGDYELFELIKDKVNLSTNYEENSTYKINKNYFFYFFENKENIENKYKIASSILQKSKENKNIKININDFDKQTGMTLLMLSVIRQYINFIKLFLENGADINLKNLIHGDTALHYATKIQKKEILEVLLKDKNCDLFIKNSKNETAVDVANNYSANTEIYSLLAGKFEEQKKSLEEKNNKDIIVINKNEKNNIIINGSNEDKNANGRENVNRKNNGKETDILKENQIKKNVEDLSSYIEIPFQFSNNPSNYLDYYDSNIKNITKNGNNEVEINNGSNQDENDVGNIKNYVKFKGAPILNINLKTKEDEDLLILENLKAENEEYDAEYEDIENRLDKLYKNHSKLLSELSEVNNKIKIVNEEMDSYNKTIRDKENKNIVSYQKLYDEEKKHNSILNRLLKQKKLLEMNNNNTKFLTDINYLDNKFTDDIFDDKYIKANLQKDILDFQKYVKATVKKKQKPIHDIRFSLQEILELNGYDYTVNVFGSYSTGLSLPWSDLDLILISKTQHEKYTANYSEEKLMEIQNLLANVDWINKPVLVTNYRAFPYLTFSTDEKHESMKVNLTIQDRKNYGYKCAKLTNNFLNSYKNMEPLVLVIKHLMKFSNILFSLYSFSETSKENINSYSIVLMVAFFIQYQIMQFDMGKVNNPEFLGELFLKFLNYYYNYDQNEKGFIFVRTGIEDSLGNDDFLLLKQLKCSLVVIDPLDHKNNVVSKDVDFGSIKFFFKLIWASCRIKCDCSCHYLKDNNEKNGNNDNGKCVDLGTEHCILKKIFKTANRINSNLLNI